MNYKFSLKAKEKEILEDSSSLLTTELFFHLFVANPAFCAHSKCWGGGVERGTLAASTPEAPDGNSPEQMWSIC